jgi:predicted N-acyltransferase
MDINNKIKILIEKNESLTVEDLLKYINGNDNKKKKKKKRRKKKKTEENKNINNIDIQIEEKDGVVENFKSYIIDSYENTDKNQKIKPNLSQAFLDKLIVLSN